MSLLSPFAKADEPEQLRVQVDLANRRILLHNTPRRTRILYAEIAAFPRFYTVDGATVAVNAANVCAVYAVTPNAVRSCYDADLLYTIADDAFADLVEPDTL